jgi:hypothetical protein
MSHFRVITMWLLVLVVPAQSWAAMAMTHCKDMQSQATNSESPAHDHAAMMQQMAETAATGQLGEHHGELVMPEQASDSAHHGHASNADTEATVADCECGCDCSGDCAMTCAASAASLINGNRAQAIKQETLRPTALRSQALAAHRFTPLRPPSAVAL